MDRTEIQSYSSSLSPRISHSRRGRKRFPGLNEGSLKHKQALSEKHPAVQVADKGYIGRGMITPPRKPAGKKLSDIAKKVSRSINRVRYIVEQVNAHIKTWKILKEDYRRPLNTFPQTITATLMLYTYTTTP
ncbi:transposase family protein [Actinomyces oris]|uniref:transposase family protein n=1 Tax=Actinomyces oris TaxID=544580 RepID=UPI00094C815F|nr:transposase family protein [Actinomyces oris]OLO58935.1 hypothetical protein BKH22_13435 [Actinomyces oris]